jgi:DNA (cytosine-5)-methyltransferase 1
MDLGFRAAGFVPIWANDIDGAAVETYNKAFDGHVAYEGDLAEVSATLPKPRSADLVIGGPPCQGFSVAGKMDPDDPRSRHVFNFIAVVKRLQPRGFVMENVKALAVNRRWQILLDELITEAEAAGYQTRLMVLNASHYDVPQARERMFLVGTAARVGADMLPPPTSEESPPTVRDALDNLPSMGGNRTPIVDQKQYEDGGDSWVVTYHEHLWSGGEPFDEVPDHLRRLTVEEAAELQTFPQGMHWAGSQSAQFRQIGNAVPPVLAYHVARAVRDAIGIS